MRPRTCQAVRAGFARCTVEYPGKCVHSPRDNCPVRMGALHVCKQPARLRPQCGFPDADRHSPTWARRLVRPSSSCNLVRQRREILSNSAIGPPPSIKGALSVNRLLVKLSEHFLVLLFALMIALVFGNVVLRYAFNSGLVSSEELSRFLFMWLTLFGALLVMREKAHLGMNLIVGRLGVRGQ